MEKKIVVHTAARPGTPLPYEREALDAPDIDFQLRGPCHTPQEVAAAVRDAQVAICLHEPFTREVFAAAPQLRAVIRYGVGVDTIDLDAATEFGVMVGHLPDFCIEEVANHALMMLLTCAKKTLQLDRTMRSRGYLAAKELQPGIGCLHGETLGLLALGNTARATALRAKAMNMNILAYDPMVAPEVFAEYGVSSVSLDDLAMRSDYVSCHLPLLPETQGMIDAAFFAKMKRSAYFINISRGSVVNEPDLIAALQNKQIAGAGLDVFVEEPLPLGHPFLSMANVVLTPHAASYADATMVTQKRRVGREAANAARGGVPQFVANRAVLAKNAVGSAS